MLPGRRRGQEGQTLPALLLVVVALIFLGLLYLQYGSGGDQATQVQTAADAASVAGAHRLRDVTVSDVAFRDLPAEFPFGTVLVATGVTPVPASGLLGIACGAARANWTANTHGSGLNCGDLNVAVAAGEVRVDVTGPAGEVARGPASVEGIRQRASSTARVVVNRCPEVIGSAEAKAVGSWLADRAALRLGTPFPSCYGLDDVQALQRLKRMPAAAQAAAVGPVSPILRAVSDGMRTEIVQ